MLPAPNHPHDQPRTLTITTPDGEVSLSDSLFGLGRILIWEHRVINAAYSDDRQDALGHAITNSHIIFTPNAGCEVRPKLPDRSGVENNQVWTETKHRVVEALKAEIIARATLEAVNWKSEAARPAVSSVLTMVAATTGWTKGRVFDDHVDVAPANSRGGSYVVLNTVEVRRLNQTDTYTVSAGGDSGGAWFIRNATNINDFNVSLAGIHYAGDGAGRAVFAPVENIRLDFTGLGTFTFCPSGTSGC